MNSVVRALVVLSLLTVANIARPDVNRQDDKRLTIQMADGPVPWPPTKPPSQLSPTTTRAVIQLADGPVPWPGGGGGRQSDFSFS